MDTGSHSKSSHATHLEHIECSEHIPLDLIDPHRAALEDNPEKAERPSLSTCLAVIVSGPPITSQFALIDLLRSS